MDITERIKTLEDAISVLGNDNQFVVDYYNLCNAACPKDIIAYAKLRIIAEALNEGWKPMFDGIEHIHYPVFTIWQKDEYDELNEDEKEDFCMVPGMDSCIYFRNAFLDSLDEYSYTSSKLVFKTAELAEYCGNQFIVIWADYLFT